MIEIERENKLTFKLAYCASVYIYIHSTYILKPALVLPLTQYSCGALHRPLSWQHWCITRGSAFAQYPLVVHP